MHRDEHLRKQSRDDVHEASKAILGDPLKIRPSQTLNPDCLYQAFASAITVFCAAEVPEGLLSNVFNQLVERVEKSNNPQAKPCLDAFKNRYRNRINSLSSSGTDDRQRDVNRRGQPAPGHR